MAELADTITFLGTGGARFMVSSQFLGSGGAWLSLGDVQILMDPGPGSLVHAVQRGFSPSRLDAILLSHRHLDHSGDINVMIEAMTDGGRKARGTVFAPADALDHDPVILSYLRSYPEKIEVLMEGGEYSVKDVCFTTPVRHEHQAETYGFVFSTPRHTFSWITDTGYFDALAGCYEGELLIINVLMVEPRPSIGHLALPEAKRVIEQVAPRMAIITHFGMTMWRAKPWELARELSEQTGVPVIAARDGMTFDLSRLDSR